MHVRHAPVGTIAVAQLFGTSLWFSTNAAASALHSRGLSSSEVGWLTSSTQVGFIAGTLFFAIYRIPDRFSPSRIFAVCAALGALLNAVSGFFLDWFGLALFMRLLVGFSLAGIYPVGMKLMIKWAPAEAPSALALLVGMLTLGTASSYLFRVVGNATPAWIMAGCSALALCAAILVLVLGDGPERTVGAPRAVDAGALLKEFLRPRLAAAAMGYFGHMWELYAFWTVLPLIASFGLPAGQVDVVVFAAIASGFVGCFAGGKLSRRFGSARVAITSLTASAVCCLIYCVFHKTLVGWPLISLLVAWGVFVIADSPQFSAMSAAACHPALIGSALTIQNSIGFALSAMSIVFCMRSFEHWGGSVMWMLLPGPILGIFSFVLLTRKARLGEKSCPSTVDAASSATIESSIIHDITKA